MLYENLKELLVAICDAIRAKDGTTAAINHQDIPERIQKLSGNGTVRLQQKTVVPSKSAKKVEYDIGYTGLSEVNVEAIPDDYIIPNGVKTIIENGSVDVTEYASVNVNVSSSAEDHKKDSVVTGSFTFGIPGAAYTEDPQVIRCPGIPTRFTMTIDDYEENDGTIANCCIDVVFDAVHTKYYRSVWNKSNNMIDATIELTDDGVSVELDAISQSWKFTALKKVQTFNYTLHYQEEQYSKTGYVHAEGTKIIDKDGNPITLKGAAIVLNMFNSATPERLATIDNDSASFSEMKSWGLNHCRTLFGYQMFEDDDSPYVYKQTGFDFLDQRIKWAKQNGMYLILNCHAPQGGTQYDFEGCEDFWSGENSSELQNRFVALWKEIARRYKNESVIAGYGLINEPQIPIVGTAEQTQKNFSELVQRTIDAVRSVDRNHMFLIERAIAVYDPNSDDYDWSMYNETSVQIPVIKDENYCYEYHYYYPYNATHDPADTSYGTDYTQEDCETYLRKRYLQYSLCMQEAVPFYIGEYGVSWNYDETDEHDQTMFQWIKDQVDVFNQFGFSYDLHKYSGNPMGFYNHKGGSGMYYDYPRYDAAIAAFAEANSEQ